MNGELLARFCGQTTPTIPIVVFTPELYVHFQTDAAQGDVGFKAKYFFSGNTQSKVCCSSLLNNILLTGVALFSGCGGWQMGEGGVISSPNYPSDYPSPSRCAWLLEAPAGHTITVSLKGT